MRWKNELVSFILFITLYYYCCHDNFIFYSVQESISKQIQKECGKIFPLQNVLIKKVKMLKKPKFDLTRLMENYLDKPEAVKQEATKDPLSKWLRARNTNHTTLVWELSRFAL